jgi:AraC-like DNA-binding protein
LLPASFVRYVESVGEGLEAVAAGGGRIAVDALAAERGMSRSHFSHYFRARTGLSPARLMTEVRIREAARTLVASAPRRLPARDRVSMGEGPGGRRHEGFYSRGIEVGIGDRAPGHTYEGESAWPAETSVPRSKPPCAMTISRSGRQLGVERAPRWDASRPHKSNILEVS